MVNFTNPIFSKIMLSKRLSQSFTVSSYDDICSSGLTFLETNENVTIHVRLEITNINLFSHEALFKGNGF